MSLPILILIALSLVAVVLVWIVVSRIETGRTRSTWTLGLLGFFLLPGMVSWLGMSQQMKQATSTEFCLSCHEMAPYGRSLRVDNPDLLPASHFQNKRIPQDYACYNCHTSYTMFGGMNDKFRGAKHVWKHFFGEPSEKLHLYDPFMNRECLHCHAGARSFQESFGHEDILEDLSNEDIRCLDCHDSLHGIEENQDAELWSPSGDAK